MSGLIGPRRAMLLLAIVLIAVGWYLRVYQIDTMWGPVVVGGVGILLGLTLIVFTILFSVFMNTCG